MVRWSLVAVAAAVSVCATAVFAQPLSRTATTAAALRASPVFFHGKQIAVLGSLVESRDLFRLEAADVNGTAGCDEQAHFRLLARAPDADRRRDSRRVLGPWPPHRERQPLFV